MSADPATISFSENECKQKAKGLIRFPIKRQVAGISKVLDKVCFEQDLTPII